MMEFEFGTHEAALSAAPVLQTQLEQIAGSKVGAKADGSRVLLSLPPLSAQKKKVAVYTAKRLAELMRSLERA